MKYSPYRNGRYVAIDIGTVTTRMLIADVDDGAVRPVHKEYTITNLGEDVDKTGVLKPEAIERVQSSIDRYLAISEQYHGKRNPIASIQAIATSAARDASNGSELVEMLEQRGLRNPIISGEQEAILSFLGTSSSFPDETIMVVDIGGGSTEIVVGESGQSPFWTHSFNIGCRRVTEKFLHEDPPHTSELYEASQWVVEEMKPYIEELEQARLIPERIVAVAGTATSVVSIRDRMEIYDSERVHLSRVTNEQLRAVSNQLARVDLESRKRIVGLDPGRANVIVAGMVILENLLRLTGKSEFTVSEADILQGIVLDAARKS